MKKSILFILLLVVLQAFCHVSAQESLNMKFSQRFLKGVPQGVTSMKDKKQDRSGNYTAVIRVNAANIQDYLFESQYLLKNETRVDTARHEATLFMAADYPNVQLRVTLTTSSLPAETIELGKLESLMVYDLKIKLVRDKSRTLVMPVMGVGGTTGFGLMIAVAKTVGPYLKFSSNFGSVTEDSKCVDAGNLVDNPSVWPYYTDVTEQSRLSVTAGALFRLWQANLPDGISTQAFYTYAGGGYGYANHYWQTTDGNWMLNTDHSHTGIELEVGVLYRYKAFSLLAGMQTNSFKYSEATIGVGVMF